MRLKNTGTITTESLFRRCFERCRRAVSWLLLVVFGFLSFFGMGLHCLAPHFVCSCHEFHHFESIKSASASSHEAGKAENFFLSSPPHSESASASESCIICTFCQMCKTVLTAQKTVVFEVVFERFISFSSTHLFSRAFRTYSTRAPPFSF